MIENVGKITSYKSEILVDNIYIFLYSEISGRKTEKVFLPTIIVFVNLILDLIIKSHNTKEDYNDLPK